MKTLSISLATCVLLLAGCQSFSSTMLNRLDDNSFQGNSNGFAKLFSKTRPYKGIPITLQVPSHLDIYIDETYYIAPGSGDGVVSEILDDTRILNVRTSIISTKKVFTVDFKRPGAGSLKLGMEFTDEQYFKTITSELEDRTIKDAAALAAQVVDSVQAFSTSSKGPDTDALSMLEERGIIRDTRTVAYQRFDINAVDFEFQVQDFVNKHLNCCNQCNGSPSYDGIEVSLDSNE